MDSRKISLIIMAWTAALLTACAGTSQQKTQESAAALQQQQNRAQIEEYLTAGRALEEQGDWPAALEKYKLALTFDPQQAEAKEKRDLLSQKLNQMAEERYQTGLKYYQQGKYGQARQEFLSALKFNPDHQEAYQMVAGRQPDKNYTTHTVKPGESLSMIAKQYYGDVHKFDILSKYNNISDPASVKPGQKIMIPKLEGMEFPEGAGKLDESMPFIEYTLRPGESISQVAKMFYGDYKQFHHIAQFNGMQDATRVSAGQKIKVPKVPGLPFNLDTAKVGEAVPPKAAPAEEKKIETAALPPPAVVPQAPSERDKAIALLQQQRSKGVESFKKNEFKQAIGELESYLKDSPQDKEARGLVSKAYFQTGMKDYNKGQFLEARKSFESALSYDSTCEKCADYIAECANNFKESHYNKGIVLFGKEQLAEAIAEWEKVQKIDPAYKDVEENLKKARFLQKKLESIKKTSGGS